jgi:membrane-bound lytic murein transglycosylase B
MITRPRILPLIALLMITFTCRGESALTAQPEVANFIGGMVKNHGFVRADLETLFADVQIRDDILTAMARPAETKPWSQYRPIFVTDDRIRIGTEFWGQNMASLQAAQREYGVPPQYVVGIVGVETRYGRHAGQHRVMDALATLAFQYPPRSTFFREQLEHYLLMTREEKIAPFSLTGSYAGAMGQPQFMPSSFRKFAVDFDGDGHRNLWSNQTDVIGSVANYFHAHGWRGGAPVVHRAQVKGADTDYDALTVRTLDPNTTFATLSAKGVSVEVSIPPGEKVALLRLEGENGLEYWVARHNFFVITRYNRSAHYAMAVHQLGESIAALGPKMPLDPAQVKLLKLKQP